MTMGAVMLQGEQIVTPAGSETDWLRGLPRGIQTRELEAWDSLSHDDRSLVSRVDPQGIVTISLPLLSVDSFFVAVALAGEDTLAGT